MQPIGREEERGRGRNLIILFYPPFSLPFFFSFLFSPSLFGKIWEDARASFLKQRGGMEGMVMVRRGAVAQLDVG